MKKLVIIDGKSVFYRGYYAMGALSTSDGTPTGGIYGFAVIAMEIVKNIRPDKVVVAWDKAGTSVAKRKAIFADYKAGRRKPREDFYVQIPLLRELVEALGWSFTEIDNYEADDIIGALGRQASKQGYETIIVSSDLDMLQIVDENVKMYRLIRGFSKLEEIDVKALEEKYGISKEQFLDLKALKGDQSDNIPGVPGIGEKWAVRLLNGYGSLDGIYEHIDEITGPVYDKLVAGKESAFMSRELAKIMFDAPVSLDEVPELKVDGARVVAALKKLEFRTLVKRFSGMLGEGGASEEVATATDSGERTGDGQGGDGAAREKIETPEILEWNVKRKMHENQEMREKVLEGAEYWDLEQGKFLLNPLERKGEDQPKQTAIAFGETEEERREKIEEYARQIEEFKKLPKVYKILTEYDLPMIPVLYKMEARGIRLSRPHFAELKKEYETIVAELEQKVWKAAGEEFNINSPTQLSSVLFEKLLLPTKGVKKTRTGYSTGAKELEKLKDLHPVVSLVMEYREAAKLLNTYIIPLPELADANDMVHTTFTQNVTATGRLSSVSPNLQNIPVRTEAGRRIREGFVARPGHKLIQADYSQFELRLAAVLSGDEALIADFNSGVDIHTKTASDVFRIPLSEVTKERRRAAKTINFGILYGMSSKSLAEQTGMRLFEAGRFIQDYFEVRKPIRQYLDGILKQARDEGYVETYYGRRRPTPDVRSANFMVKAAAERAAANMPIQGTEADLMKRAMIRLDKALPDGAEMVLQIHDSLIIECPDELAEEVSAKMKEIMEGVAPELKIRLEVEVKVGENLGGV